jgi:hypothetical protein
MSNETIVGITYIMVSDTSPCRLLSRMLITLLLAPFPQPTQGCSISSLARYPAAGERTDGKPVRHLGDITANNDAVLIKAGANF